MPIVSVYGRYSKGLERRTPTADVTGSIRAADIVVAGSTDVLGNPTLEGYQAAINVLKPLASEPKVALKILQFENLALGLNDDINRAVGDVTFFQETLSDALDEAGQRQKDDPLGLILTTAELYIAAFDDYNRNEMPQIMARFKGGQKIPDEVFNYSDELERRMVAVVIFEVTRI